MTTAATHDTRGNTAAPPATVPPQVVELLRRHDLEGTASVLQDLVRDTFAGIQNLRFELDVDPDTGTERAVLNVTVDIPPDRAIASYRDFVRKWTAAATPQVHNLLRLSYHTLQGE